MYRFMFLLCYTKSVQGMMVSTLNLGGALGNLFGGSKCVTIW